MRKGGADPLDRVAAISALLAFCLFTGCMSPQPWHLTAHKDGDTVQLCLSQQSECPQPGGVSVYGISVYRYDSTYNNELIWETSSDSETTDKTDGIITYGIPPKGWHNKMTPPALVCGKAYLVNPATIFFALKCDGTVVVFDFLQLEEFFRQETQPVPPKKRTG